MKSFPSTASGILKSGISRLKNFNIPSTKWENSIKISESLVHPKGGSVIQPKEILGNDFKLLNDNISKLLTSNHPILDTISKYYFTQQGKHIRPLIVLLMSLASSSYASTANASTQVTINTGFSTWSHPIFFPQNSTSISNILPTQRRLAEITEMIHTASLLHDDVIDNSMLRRAAPSANAEYGNKMAVLAGDFLLARASVALARLRNVHVVELLATVISNLVEGEFMQLRNSSNQPNQDWNSKFEYYMEKTYMKTASLIAKSCEASTVLSGCDEYVSKSAYIYGKNLGLAFQVIDDLLDFVVSADDFGKPVNADLKLGLATAPVLYAAQEYPQLFQLMDRKFSHEGDIETAKQLVFKSQGLQKTKSLATDLCKKAADSISSFPQSPAKDALIDLTNTIITRTK